jgi:uncharacterized protein involved in cysteine biosynthesis
MAVGIGLMSLVVFAKQIMAAVPSWSGFLQPLSTIAYPWYVLIGTLITLATGMIASLFHSSSPQTQTP